MADKNVFLIDGIAYNVHVTDLVRKFSVLDTDKSGRTLNGEMYRDPIGTFYNYTMTVEPKNGDTNALDAFWEAISQPVASHLCTFPYGQTILTQRMYITSGEQPIIRMVSDKNYWGALNVNFIAMSPKVTV